jgi:cytochrome c553
MTNRILLLLSFTLLVAACSPDQSNPVAGPDTEKPAHDTPVALQSDPDEKIASEESNQAKAAIAAFASALQAELKNAMQQGGPVNAIGVCNTTAMPITAKVSLEQGLTLSRVSLKNRNPANAPNDWQGEVLESFEKRKAGGEELATMAWSEIAESDGKQQFRFMKAIPTGALCLQCHGSDISPEVSSRLAELYPGDKATGYAAGDIRGAFVVTRNLP